MSEYLGKTIGEYQLLEMIAGDENAITFKGFRPSTNSYVLVIVLKPHIAKDMTKVQRFFDSVKVAAQMHHPNILQVYDAGQAEGLFYYVISFIETGTLRDNLSVFQNTNMVLELVNRLSAALEYVHARGYVHGNLKSSNIYIDAQHSPYISGIGITPGGSIVPDAYCSPEQVQGLLLDKRSDVFSLGVLVYEVLVGFTPPPGMIVSLRSRIPNLPGSVERVILKSMAQNPDERFQDVAEFRTAFQNAIQVPEPSVVFPVATVPGVNQTVHVSQPKSTNWAGIILGILLVAILISAVVFFIIPGSRNNEETVVIQPTAVESSPAPTAMVPTPVPTVVVPTPEQTVVVPPPDQSPGDPPNQSPEAPPWLPDDIEIPEVCSSVFGVGGFVLVSMVLTNHRRKRP